MTFNWSPHNCPKNIWTDYNSCILAKLDGHTGNHKPALIGTRGTLDKFDIDENIDVYYLCDLMKIAERVVYLDRLSRLDDIDDIDKLITDIMDENEKKLNTIQ